MNLTMYCDSEKNLLMFLPDGITDAEIMALGSVAFPDGDSNVGSSKVPTGIINLYDLHASFSLDVSHTAKIIPSNPYFLHIPGIYQMLVFAFLHF